MDIAKWIETQWGAISGAPAVYLGTIVLVWVAATAFTRWRLGDEAAAAKERSQYLKDRVQELEAHKTELLNKLESHGEDIAEIKRDLNSRPRLHVGPEEPKHPKVNDLWVDTK